MTKYRTAIIACGTIARVHARGWLGVPGQPTQIGAIADTNADALREFGLDPAAIPKIARKKAEVLAYAELHIEQGPVLESEGLPVGVVTAINGFSRQRVTLRGAAGHAGTVPMNLRREGAPACYIETGVWSKKAVAESKLFGETKVLATSAATKFDRIPDMPAASTYAGASAVLHDEPMT